MAVNPNVMTMPQAGQQWTPEDLIAMLQKQGAAAADKQFTPNNGGAGVFSPATGLLSGITAGLKNNQAAQGIVGNQQMRTDAANALANGGGTTSGWQPTAPPSAAGGSGGASDPNNPWSGLGSLLKNSSFGGDSGAADVYLTP